MRTLKEKIRDWNWDPNDIVDWAKDTAMYWIDAHGLVAYLLITGVVLFTLLNWDVTRHMTSLVMARVWNGAMTAVLGVVAWVLTQLLAWTGNASVASMRNFVRYALNRRRGAPAEARTA